MTVEVPLSGSRGDGLVMLVDDEWTDFFEGRRVYVGSHGYAVFALDGHDRLVHRHITGCVKGDGLTVDHENQDQLDNRAENLRVSPRRTINSANRNHGPDRGVYKKAGKWYAQAQLRGKHVHLGQFPDKDEARRVAHEWRVENMPGYPGGKVRADV